MKKYGLFFTSLLLLLPATAHELQTDGDVGALMHIQPDDNPRAKVFTTAWFGLVQRGGTPIPLSQCACSLQIYVGEPQPGQKPVLTPKLQERKVQDGIGSQTKLTAQLKFPRTGAYTMVLAGKPKATASFPVFRLSWVVEAVP
jgi:hypothetical protein